MTSSGKAWVVLSIAAGFAWTGVVQAGDVREVELVVEVEGIRSDVGKACVAVYDAAGEFPKAGGAFATSCAKIAGGRAVVRFSLPAPKRYAVYAFHDEDGNGVLKTNWIGMPKEGVGVSRGAKGFMGPPKFEDAAFSISSSASTTIRLSLKYL